MATFDHLQRKRPLASASARPAPSLLWPSRQFAPLATTTSEQDTTVTQAQFGHAAPLQFSIERIPIFPPAKKNNTGLPNTLKAGVEQVSGLSMDDVQVHYNSSQPAEVQALAYTQGTNIHIGPGQEQHLPHEAWHVVQQKQGRVQPTMQANGVAMNNDQELEREATTVGREVVHGSPMHGRGTDVVLRSLQNGGPIQMAGEEEKHLGPPPLPPKPSAIRVAKFLYPFFKEKTEEERKRPLPRADIPIELMEIAITKLLDALYAAITGKEFSIGQASAVKGYAISLSGLLISERRKAAAPDVQQRLDVVLNQLKPLRELNATSSASRAAIRANLESDLEFFLKITQRY